MMDATSIPQFQQAAVLNNPGPSAQIAIRHDIPVGSPGPEEVLIKLSHSGIWYVLHLPSLCFTNLEELMHG